MHRQSEARFMTIVACDQFACDNSAMGKGHKANVHSIVLLYAFVQYRPFWGQYRISIETPFAIERLAKYTKLR